MLGANQNIPYVFGPEIDTVTINLLERTITCVLRARRTALPNQLGDPAWVYDKAMAHRENTESKVLTVTL